MRKTFILVIATFVISFTTAHAQISIFPKAGISLGKYLEDKTALYARSYPQSYPHHLGLVAGVGATIPIAASNYISFQPELIYIQKGRKAVSSGNSFFEIKEKRILNYLEIPLLVKASLGNKAIKAFLLAGPSFGFGLNGKYTTSGYYSYYSTTTITEGNIRFKNKPDKYTGDDLHYDSEKYNRIDIGIQFGGGVGFQIGSGTLFLDARFGLGLNRLMKKTKHMETRYAVYTFNSELVMYDFNSAGKVKVSDPENEKSRTLAFTVGYAVPIGK